MNVGTLNGKTAEVNGIKPKSLRYRFVKQLVSKKRAEQGNFPYSALQIFLWVFSATILRPLTSARNYATIADRKRQIRRTRKVVIQSGRSYQRNRGQKIIRTSDILRGSDYSGVVTPSGLEPELPP